MRGESRVVGLPGLPSYIMGGGPCPLVRRAQGQPQPQPHYDTRRLRLQCIRIHKRGLAFLLHIALVSLLHRSPLRVGPRTRPRLLPAAYSPLVAAMAGNPPTLPPVGTETDFNPNFDTPTPSANGHDAATPVDSPVPEPKTSGLLQEAQDSKVREQVQHVLYSDIGVTTLLNRLKASIASARVILFS